MHEIYHICRLVAIRVTTNHFSLLCYRDRSDLFINEACVPAGLGIAKPPPTDAKPIN